MLPSKRCIKQTTIERKGKPNKPSNELQTSKQPSKELATTRMKIIQMRKEQRSRRRQRRRRRRRRRWRIRRWRKHKKRTNEKPSKKHVKPMGAKKKNLRTCNQTQKLWKMWNYKNTMKTDAPSRRNDQLKPSSKRKKMMHGNWRTHRQRATTTTTTCNNDAMPLPMPTSPETIDNVRNKTRKATSIKRMSNQHKYWHMVTRTQMAGNAICSKQNKHIMHSCTMAHPSWSFDDNDQNHFWICISNCHRMCKYFVWNLNCFDVSNKLNSMPVHDWRLLLRKKSTGLQWNGLQN